MIRIILVLMKNLILVSVFIFSLTSTVVFAASATCPDLTGNYQEVDCGHFGCHTLTITQENKGGLTFFKILDKRGVDVTETRLIADGKPYPDALNATVTTLCKSDSVEISEHYFDGPWQEGAVASTVNTSMKRTSDLLNMKRVMIASDGQSSEPKTKNFKTQQP